jgi:hypothetical protein
VNDADPEVASLAEATVARLPAPAVAAFLARSDVGAEVREFFAARGIVPADVPAPTGDAPLLEEPQAAGEVAQEMEIAGGEPHPPGVAGAVSAGQTAGEAAADEDDAMRRGAAQRLALLTVAQRMKVAMQGSREERSILIRDPNRLVSASVLSSPKLTESEVEAIARMTNVSDEVLRTVGTTRTWTKNYNVLAALARNPKTPIAISLGLLSRLNERDIKMLSTDRNIPEPIRVASRKMYVHNQSRRQ